MNKIAASMKLLSDVTRLRILMLLSRRELCVCQIMGILGISQPLVSRNLRLLQAAGFLDERRRGKLVFYMLRRDLAPAEAGLVGLLKESLKDDTMLARDLGSLRDCEAFQKKTGRCDMKTLAAFMARKKNRPART